MRWARRAAVIALALGVSAPRWVSAAGFDTPTLYTARHQGMGGTAIGAVDDASAPFHNPAGLQGVQGLALIGDFTPTFAHLDSSPDRISTAESKRSELIFAPFFYAGAAYRLGAWVAVGLGVFPVASGGASYEYAVPGSERRVWDSTKIVFLEATPAIALTVPQDRLLPGALSVGLGYRVDTLSFNRQKGDRDSPEVLDLSMRGASFGGYRVGVQWAPTEAWSFGVVYRNRIEITARADDITVYRLAGTDAELPFVLPAKLGWGGRLRVGALALAADYEFAWQSQNDRATLVGTLGGREGRVPNVYAWQDATTVRLGAEYALDLGAARMPLRTGYIYDGAVTNPAYPSSAGTPPAPTHTATVGAGYARGRWATNVAVMRRLGNVTVEESELGSGCAFCAFAGDYRLRATAVAVDFSAVLGKARDEHLPPSASGR